MRSFDELMASEYVIDWTPAEMRMFIKEVMTETTSFKRTLTKSKIIEQVAPLKKSVMERLEEMSRSELIDILNEMNNFEVKLSHGEFDNEQQE